jgi:hypothetical protein
MLTDSLLNKNFDMNLAPHSTVGWLEGQNSPDDACSPRFAGRWTNSTDWGAQAADASF